MLKRSRGVSPDSQSSNSPQPAADHHRAKYFQTAEDSPPPHEVMKCSLPPHEPLSFTTFADYEVHYAQSHTNRCLECRKNFPTEHFLNLHIAENHDPLDEARRARGEKTYCCFVPDCEKVCSTPQKRRMHLVDKHMFPKNYDFLIVKDGLDKRSSMLRSSAAHHRRRSSAATRAQERTQLSSHGLIKRANGDGQLPIEPTSSDQVMQNPTEAAAPSSQPGNEGAESAPEIPTFPPPSLQSDGVDVLTSTMSRLSFVPPSVRFGRGGRRGGLARS